ncbi:hypothetical protein CRG98_042578 [Punica granatum]|uniref:Uncharacterized protein n=1 Tax=Punica granatum TaxID=22663 RepID=A0A2I0HZA8_PUNGR|nr:hypothetical protein CRG98_042578 [Punica granatum]
MPGPIDPDHNEQESRPGTTCFSNFLVSFDISSSLVVTSCNIFLLGKNPASLFRVKYSHVMASLSIDSAPLCPSSVVPGFTQATRSTYEIVARFCSVLVVINHVNDQYLMASLSSGRDITNVEINLRVRQRVALGSVWVPVTDLSVWCTDLVFSLGTDGNVSEAAIKWMVQLGGLGSCDISFFDVI